MGLALGPLLRRLDGEQAAARAALAEAMGSGRYRDLVARLVEAAHGPTVAEGRWPRCRVSLPRLGVRLWRRLRKAGRRLGPQSPDAAFHEARKCGKDARHAAEAIGPWLGPTAVAWPAASSGGSSRCSTPSAVGRTSSSRGGIRYFAAA